MENKSIGLMKAIDTTNADSGAVAVLQAIDGLIADYFDSGIETAVEESKAFKAFKKILTIDC